VKDSVPWNQKVSKHMYLWSCNDAAYIRPGQSHYSNELRTFFIYCARAQSGLGRLIVEVARLHTTRHTWQDTSETMISSSQRPLLTQQTQQMNISALSGIRTRDPTNQAATVLHLRPHGHRNRQLRTYVLQI